MSIDLELPPLPRELERHIFELAATNPEDPYHPPLHLLLVCKAINVELKSILYRTVILKDYSENTTFPTTACKYIRNLLVECARWPMREFFKLCTDLKVFGSYDLGLLEILDKSEGEEEEVGYYGIPRTIALRRFWGSWGWDRQQTAFWEQALSSSSPQLMMLTHLDTTMSPMTADMLEMMSRSVLDGGMPCLTHFALQYFTADCVGVMQRILEKRLDSLEVVVVYQFEWHRANGGFNELSGAVYELDLIRDVRKGDSEKRLVCFSSVWLDLRENAEEWLKSVYRHRLDMWGVAEGIRDAQRGGYFKDPDVALGWISPSPEGIREVLHDWGVDKLAQRSELWADYLGVNAHLMS